MERNDAMAAIRKAEKGKRLVLGLKRNAVGNINASNTQLRLRWSYLQCVGIFKFAAIMDGESLFHALFGTEVEILVGAFVVDHGPPIASSHQFGVAAAAALTENREKKVSHP